MSFGLKSGARNLNQSLSEVIMTQSNSQITFDTQLKAVLKCDQFSHFLASFEDPGSNNNAQFILVSSLLGLKH